jgi:hypothetical protein
MPKDPLYRRIRIAAHVERASDNRLTVNLFIAERMRATASSPGGLQVQETG